MMKNDAINSSKRACKILAERKLLSAVTVLQRDENWYFSIFIYLIINKLSFKNGIGKSQSLRKVTAMRCWTMCCGCFLEWPGQSRDSF